MSLQRILCSIAALSFIAVSLAAVTSTATAAQTLRLSMNVNQQSPWFEGAKKFAELIEKDTDRRYKIRIFPNAQLFMGNDQAEISGVQQGTVALEIKDSGWMASVNDKFSAPLLPFLFPNHEVAAKVLDGPAGDKLLDLLPKYNLVGLAWGVNGFRQITNSVRPIKTPADVRGLKIRTPGARVWLDTWKTLGAAPTAMSFSEVFTALQTGAVEAQENPYSLIWANKFYEVQKYLTQCNYMYAPIIFMMNKDKWDSLSPEDQKIFRRDAKKAMEYERGIVKKQDKTLPEKLKAQGMQITVLDQNQLNAFKEALQPVYKDMQPIMGKDIIDLFVSESEKAAQALAASSQ